MHSAQPERKTETAQRIIKLNTEFISHLGLDKFKNTIKKQVQMKTVMGILAAPS